MGIIRDSALRLLSSATGNRTSGASTSRETSQKNNEVSSRSESCITNSLKELLIYSTDSTVISLCRKEGEQHNIRIWGASTLETLRCLIPQLQCQNAMIVFYLGPDEEIKESSNTMKLAKVSRDQL